MLVDVTKHEDVKVLRLTNGTGAPVAQGSFVVNHGFAAVAEKAIASGAVGPWWVEEGIQVRAKGAAKLKAGEDTFGTLGQEVYWDPASDKFSDTLTAGYYAVGRLTVIKSAAAGITFDKYRYADLVTPDET